MEVRELFGGRCLVTVVVPEWDSSLVDGLLLRSGDVDFDSDRYCRGEVILSSSDCIANVGDSLVYDRLNLVSDWVFSHGGVSGYLVGPGSIIYVDSVNDDVSDSHSNELKHL